MRVPYASFSVTTYCGRSSGADCETAGNTPVLFNMCVTLCSHAVTGYEKGTYFSFLSRAICTMLQRDLMQLQVAHLKRPPLTPV